MAETGQIGESARTAAVRSSISALFNDQLAVLADARQAHSHSDLLLPPDLAMQVLQPTLLAFKADLDATLTGDAPFVEICRRDVLPLLARGLIFDELNRSPTTSSNRLGGIADERAVFDRLDVVLKLELDGYLETGVPLLIHEEMLDRLTIEACSSHFSYIESRIELLTQGLVPSKGKGLVLLRICNELVRRLSKPTRSHTIFAGRVLSLLSGVLPLGERSGVNFRGDFNVDNVTTIDSHEAGEEQHADNVEQDDDDAESHAANDANLSKEERKANEAKAQRSKDEALFRSAQDNEVYTMFWHAQRWFANPLVLTEEPDGDEGSEIKLPSQASDPLSDGSQRKRMVQFRTATRYIFDLLGAVSRLEKELSGAAKGSQPLSKTSTSDESSVDTNNLPEVGMHLKPNKRAKLQADDDGQQKANGENDFFPKYLTNRNLFEYELRDATFRRHIVVQYLILFQFLLTFTPKHREQMESSKNKSLANAIYSNTFTLDEADEQWIRSSWRDAVSMLQAVPPEGRWYADTVLLVLQRETNWLRWKSEDCPPIDVAQLDKERLSAYMRAAKALKTPLRRYPHALGTAALSRLWEDGVRRPEPGTRTMENAEGLEVQVKTDGLDELEMGPMIPTLETYAAQVSAFEEKERKRRQELEWEPARPFVIGGMQTTADMRKGERERIAREEKDATMARWAQQRSVAAWRAMRMARTEYIDCFAKMRCDLPGGGTAIGARIDDVTRLMQSISDKANGIPALPTPAPAPPSPPPVVVTAANDGIAKIDYAGSEKEAVRSEPAAGGSEADTVEKQDGGGEASESAEVSVSNEPTPRRLSTDTTSAAQDDSPAYEPEMNDSARSSIAVPNEEEYSPQGDDEDIEMQGTAEADPNDVAQEAAKAGEGEEDVNMNA